MTPYFTTKIKGTGLGLPIVSKIINEHSGDFLIKNTQWKIFEYGEVWCEQGEPIVLHQGSLDKFTWNKESE